MREPTRPLHRDARRRRVLRATSALAAAACILPPGTAFAAWGEAWGDMVWGASAPPEAVPLLGTEGLLLLAGALALAGAYMAARRRRA